MLHIPTLYIADSPLGGRGVFVGETLEAGNVIEICPVIVLSEKDKEMIHQTHLHDYYFLWGEAEKQAVIALGYGSLYNHSFAPNASFMADHDAKTLIIESTQQIGAGEEITINYNGDGDFTPLWF